MKKLFWLLVAAGIGFAVWRRCNQPAAVDRLDRRGRRQDWVKNADGQWVRAGAGSEAAPAEGSEATPGRMKKLGLIVNPLGRGRRPRRAEGQRRG